MGLQLPDHQFKSGCRLSENPESIVFGILFLCAEHGTNLAGASPATGFSAKYSEPQVGISNDMDGGNDVIKFLSLRTET